MPTAIIDKVFDIFTKQTPKIPKALIILFISTAMLPHEAIIVKNILINKIELLLPKSVMEYISKLQFSQEEFLYLWFFLLVLFVIALFLDALHQILQYKTPIILGEGVEILLEINSVTFLIILIYNTLYYPGIQITQVTFLSPTFKFFLIASIPFFALGFIMTYCEGFVRLFQKIGDTDSSKKKFLLYIIFAIIVCPLVGYVLQIFYR